MCCEHMLDAQLVTLRVPQVCVMFAKAAPLGIIEYLGHTTFAAWSLDKVEMCGVAVCVAQAKRFMRPKIASSLHLRAQHFLLGGFRT